MRHGVSLPGASERFNYDFQMSSNAFLGAGAERVPFNPWANGPTGERFTQADVGSSIWREDHRKRIVQWPVQSVGKQAPILTNVIGNVEDPQR